MTFPLKVCEQCGVFFKVTKQTGKKRYCSKKCYKDSCFIGQLSRRTHEQRENQIIPPQI